MGRIFSSLAREAKNYNVESRAHKVISESTRPSTKYPSTAKQAKLVEERGITVEDLAKKDEGLHENLKNVYLTSEGDMPSTERTSRSLPTNRGSDMLDSEYGYVEPIKTPPGKISLKGTLELLSKYHEDPAKWTTDQLASHHSISTKLAEQLVDRYQVFELHMPTNEISAKNKPLETKVQIQKALHNLRQITLVSDKRREEKSDSVTEIKPT